MAAGNNSQQKNLSSFQKNFSMSVMNGPRKTNNQEEDELRKAYLEYFSSDSKNCINNLLIDTKEILESIPDHQLTENNFDIISNGVRYDSKDVSYNGIISLGTFNNGDQKCNIITGDKKYYGSDGLSRFNVVIYTEIFNNQERICFYDPGALQPIILANMTTGELSESKCGDRKILFASPNDTLFLILGHDPRSDNNDFMFERNGCVIKITPKDGVEYYSDKIYVNFGISKPLPPGGFQV